MKKDIIVIKIPLLDMDMAEAQHWFKLFLMRCQKIILVFVSHVKLIGVK